MTSVASAVFVAFATQDRKSVKAAGIVWTVLAALLVALVANVRSEPERLLVLRILLVLLAAGEAGGAVAQGLLTRPTLGAGPQRRASPGSEIWLRLLPRFIRTMVLVFGLAARREFCNASGR